MHTISTLVLLTSVLTLGLVASISTAAPTSILGQAFDITTEQGEESAIITVKLATNNTVVIPPNGTIIEVPGNVTQIDNDTVVIVPENETVTEVPGNVTVITPPAPEPCGCPVANETTPAAEPEIPPVLIRPAPGQNITEVPPSDNVTIPVLPAEPSPPAPATNETTGGEFPTQLPVFPAENETLVVPSPGENITVAPPAEGGADNSTGFDDEGGAGVQPSFGSFPIEELRST